MKLEDYISAMTVGMVRAPDRRAIGLAVLARSFELENPCQPGARSLAVRGADGALIGYRAWIASIPGPANAGTAVIHADNPDLPPRIAEAFAGTNSRIVCAGQRAHRLEVLRSRPYALGSADFVAWTRSQPAADAAFQRVAAFVTESNQLNGRAPVAASEVGTYLTSPDGAQVFDTLAIELVREVQIAVRQSGQKLVKPDHGWFSAPVDIDEHFGRVSQDEQLELLGEVTAQDLTTLFDAQSCRAEVWAAVRRKLAEWRMAEDLSAVPRDGLGMIHRTLLGEMQAVCRDLHAEVVRPLALADRLGTHIDHMSELERHEYLPANERLMLADNARAWECWCLRDIGPAPAIDDRPALATAAAELLEALDAIAELARRMQSGFAEAFATAAGILRSHEALALLEPETRDAALEQWSERARGALSTRMAICDDLAAVGYGESSLRALLAHELASVFGGMGSWNDEAPPETLAAEYEALSARLFECLERLRTSVA